MRPPVRQPALAGFVLVDTDFESVVKIGRVRLLPIQNGSEWRVVSGEWRKGRTTGLRDNGQQDRRNGETEKRGDGETERGRSGEITHHALRITDIKHSRFTHYGGFRPCAEFAGS